MREYLEEKWKEFFIFEVNEGMKIEAMNNEKYSNLQKFRVLYNLGLQMKL